MIEKRELYYGPAKQNRKLHIWLPDNYYQSMDRYPVMYMFDGHNLFFDRDATYGKSWGLKSFLSRWRKDMIVVGMECSHDGYSRLSEYCPYNQTMFGHNVKGIGEQTFQWIINEVKPWVDGEYRTYGHREATAIGGSSMGGLMSLYGVIAHNDVFSKAACLSSGIAHNEKNLWKTEEENEIDADTRVYMSWGEHEMGNLDSAEARAARKMSEGLTNSGAAAVVYYQEGGGHSEQDWEKQVPIFMDFLWF